MPVIRRRVHAIYRCFTHLKGACLWMGTVFHPPFSVDGHGVSPTHGTVFHPPKYTVTLVTTRACKNVTRARVF
jgi:hypothetical protein